MVLVRSENGQLLMIPQQALAQMQAQAHAQAQPQTTMAPRPATPTSAPPVQISTVQVSTRPASGGLWGVGRLGCPGRSSGLHLHPSAIPPPVTPLLRLRFLLCKVQILPPVGP